MENRKAIKFNRFSIKEEPQFPRFYHEGDTVIDHRDDSYFDEITKKELSQKYVLDILNKSYNLNLLSPFKLDSELEYLITKGCGVFHENYRFIVELLLELKNELVSHYPCCINPQLDFEIKRYEARIEAGFKCSNCTRIKSVSVSGFLISYTENVPEFLDNITNEINKRLKELMK